MAGISSVNEKCILERKKKQNVAKHEKPDVVSSVAICRIDVHLRISSVDRGKQMPSKISIFVNKRQ